MTSTARHLRLCICLICILAAAQLQADTTRAEHSRQFEVGIDRSNMIWEPKPKQASIFAGIRTMGVRWFRDAFAYPPDRTSDFVDIVRQAKRARLKMLVVVTQDASDYDGTAPMAENAGPAFQRLCGWPGGSLKLSRMNLSKFKNRLRGLLSSLKAAKLDVDAFEIGNEVDWVCFNGDVPFGRAARPNDILIAARGYARVLQAAAEVIRNPRFFPNAKIITFGMSHADAGWDNAPPHHLPNPAAFVASLRHLDGVNYLSNARYHVDGYGTHIYPDPDDIKRSTAATLAKDTEALGSDLPIWITEFGLRKKRFPNRAGENRSQAIRDFFEALAHDSRNSFGPVFYYDYDGPSWGLTDARGHLLPEARALAQQCRTCSTRTH